MTSKEYMHCVTTVDPHWLAEMGSMFFTVKEPKGGRRLKSQIENEEKKKLDIELELLKDEPTPRFSGATPLLSFGDNLLSTNMTPVIFMGSKTQTPKFKPSSMG
jgi:hypothetical protein